MGKSYSRTSNLNKGYEETDGSRRVEIGIVNYDSHGASSSMSWFEIVTLLSFIVTLLFVIWECVKFCISKSFRDRMIRREENVPQPPPPYSHGSSPAQQVSWIQARPDFVRINVPALPAPTEGVQQPSNVSAIWQGAI